MKWCLCMSCLATLLVAGAAIAGSAAFDRATRTYSLTYTFARLPGADGLMRLGGAYEPGQVQTPPPERVRQIEGEIRRILSDVNRKLVVATRGNAQVGSLTYVRDPRTADLIIALDSPSDRGGVAVPLGGAGDGRPGHFYLYYDYLKGYASGNRDGVVDTIAHELCHYFFGLPDEYRDASAARRCPLAPGPGCLMDNYWVRGATGSLCGDRDHNPLAPSAVFTGERSDSCEAILRRYFRGIGLDPDEAAASRPPLDIKPSAALSSNPDPDDPVDRLAEQLASDASGSAAQRASSVFRGLRDARKSDGPLDDAALLRLYELASETTARVRAGEPPPRGVPPSNPPRRRSLVIAPDPPARLDENAIGRPVPDAKRIEEFQQHRAEGLRQFLAATDRGQFDVRADVATGSSDPARVATDVLTRAERDGIEVVTVLVPPGGLHPSTNAVFAAMRRSYLSGDRPSLRRLRLNLGLVEDSVVTGDLRDLCLRSGGTILTITDLDEIGAVMQRLALDQAQGNWVIVPEKGVLRIPALDLAGAAFADPGSPEKLANYRRALGVTDAASIDPEREDPPGAAPKALRERIWPFLVEHRPITFAARDRISPDGSAEIVLKPFYVDGMTDYELIVGLSRRLPGLSSAGSGESPSREELRRMPRLGFRPGASSDPSGPLDRGPAERKAAGPIDSLDEELTLDWPRSGGSTLVFRLPGPRERGLPQGWYTPVLRLPRRLLGSMQAGKFVPAVYPEGVLRYTFSVGTPHAASQIQAGLIQARTFPRNAPGGTIRLGRQTDAQGDIYRGTLDPREDFTVFQVEVRAGLPIAGATVRGYSQRLEDASDRPVRTVPVVFRDDGVGEDLAAGDGIYTAVLGLARDDRRSAEYRVFVEVWTADGARFVPMESRGERGPDAPAPRFQRATSFQFRLPGRDEKS